MVDPSMNLITQYGGLRISIDVRVRGGLYTAFLAPFGSPILVPRATALLLQGKVLENDLL